MKIIILAAGRGKRMKNLTDEMPKPLLKFAGRSALDHIFAALPDEIDEAVIVVKYFAERIMEHCGNEFYGRKIHYVEGSDWGTAFSFMAARPFVRDGERFAVVYGDEYITAEEMRRCLNHQYSWLCYPVDDPTKVGIAEVGADGNIKNVIEKPRDSTSNLAADGLMIVDSDIFNYMPDLHVDGECYFSTMMNKFAKGHDVFAVLGSPEHGQITAPEDLKLMENKIL